jgi:hypothetical protein
MNKDLRDKYLSEPRYSRFLNATRGHEENASKLYEANVALSQAFHPLLSQFEVVLRNALDFVLARHFKDNNWIITEKSGFMSSFSLKKSQFYLKRCVENIEIKLVRAKVPVSSSKVISEQTLGFWKAFFSPLHYKLVQGQAIHVFANKPPKENRASIHGKLEAVREFRNRVNHCEPICFKGHQIDCSYAIEMWATVMHLVQWIDPRLMPFFMKLDRVEENINRLLRLKYA